LKFRWVSIPELRALHDDIHWGPDLYFSTSDNSNPLANGRRYEIVNLVRDTTTRT